MTGSGPGGKIGVVIPLIALLIVAVSSVSPTPSSPSEGSGLHTYAGPAELDPTVLADAVAKLNGLGIVEDTQYWLDNAQKGKVVPTASMREVMILAAAKFDPATTIEEALEILQRQKILTDMERWRFQLIDKSSISGADAYFLLKVLADKIN